jgi:hypothetical protein
MARTGPLGNVTLGDTVRLRLTLLIRGLHMEDQGPLTIPVKATRELEVQYRRPTSDELEQGADSSPPLSLGDTMCVIGGTWRVSEANREPFSNLACDGGLALTQTLVVFGAVQGTGMRAWDALPESLRNMLDVGIGELARAADRTFRLMRWHWQLPGEHNPFRMWSFSWSPDENVWQDLPWKMPLRAATVVHSIRASEAQAREIADAVANGADEPTGHELLREALYLADENPRSALIVGMAAAEIGLKEFVSRRVPAASWLVTETSTPPLLQMLTQYLPDLLKHLKLVPLLQFVDGKEKGDFKDPVLRELGRGVFMRNRLVHKPVAAPEPDDVRSVLLAVQDLLGMLDYYSGDSLGRSFIRSATHAVWYRQDATLPK